MSHKISDFPSTTGVLRCLTCPKFVFGKFVFGRGSAPDPAGGAHDAPAGCENEAKIKWLYEGETATLGLHQMGNQMKKVGNRWCSIVRYELFLCTDFEIQQYEIEINKELQISAGEW